MSEQSSQDKTEKASPQKVKKARQEGQIPRAKEFTTAVIFLAVAMFFLFPAQQYLGKHVWCIPLQHDPNQS
ncbi:Required for formation of the rod structure in the basal body of the flagellar apparatus. Together with FliI and FliH [Vibrio sp. B1FIG11]|nr:Required for formation of the rod structure in the basal body of the flagellar apparatus. Together with FliI and FliH [Vibrio sp. B1FIG11]